MRRSLVVSILGLAVFVATAAPAASQESEDIRWAFRTGLGFTLSPSNFLLAVEAP